MKHFCFTPFFPGLQEPLWYGFPPSFVPFAKTEPNYHVYYSTTVVKYKKLTRIVSEFQNYGNQ